MRTHHPTGAEASNAKLLAHYPALSRTITIAALAGLSGCAYPYYYSSFRHPSTPALAYQEPQDSVTRLNHEIWKRIAESYYRDIDVDSAVPATEFVNTLDPHSHYQPEARSKAEKLELANSGLGLGLGCTRLDSGVIITWVEERGAARQAGIWVGDRIDSLNHQLAVAMTDHAICNVLFGHEGTAELAMTRPCTGSHWELSLTGEQVINPLLPQTFMLDSITGYVWLSKFGHGTSTELSHAADSLKRVGMKRLVLDLRGCPGGYVTEIVNCARLFIGGESLLYKEQSYRGIGTTYFAFRTAPFAELPIVTLVNDETASAAETLAGIFQDYGRSVIVGEPTYGKGLETKDFKLSNGDYIKLADNALMLPSGRCVQRSYTGTHYECDVPVVASGNNIDHALDTMLAERYSRPFRTPRGVTLYSHQGIVPDIMYEERVGPEGHKYYRLIDSLATNFAFAHAAEFENMAFHDFQTDYRFPEASLRTVEQALEEQDSLANGRNARMMQRELEPRFRYWVGWYFWYGRTWQAYQSKHSEILRRARMAFAEAK